MSNYQLPPPENPYASPLLMAEAGPLRAVEPRPTICVVAFVISLLFGLLRLPLVIFGIVMLLRVQPPGAVADPILMTLPMEVLTGGAVVLLGFIGNIALLLKQRWGPLVGYMTAVASLANMSVAIWQLSFSAPPNDNPMMVNVFFGAAAVAIVVRLTTVGLYVWAVAHYSRWLARQAM
jgi:hypothetical protein